MNKKYGRLLFILMIGAWLMGLASTGALAALSLGPSPADATANSVWNMAATWTDTEGIWPTLENATRTEGLTDYGLMGTTWGATIGTVRAFIPADWADTLVWYPAMPAPDGFVGFADPGAPDALTDEKYQPVGYVSVQPDPVDAGMETDADAGYDHGVDYIRDEADAADGSPGINLDNAKGAAVPAPNADGSLTQTYVPSQPAADGNEATPDVIVTSRVPVFLVGVWTVDTHQANKRIAARIINAQEINAAWPAYNVIKITGNGGKLPAGTTRLFISYYAPGLNYVITDNSPLPMPYTVYKVPVADTGANYLMINDGILKLDPNRDGDMNDAMLTADKCPVIGVYRTAKLDQATTTDPTDTTIATNFFDVANDPVPNVPDVRYEAPDSTHPTYGKLFFTKPVDSKYLAAGTSYYIVVSTNAVDGVYDDATGAGTNYYLRPKNAPGDPDQVYGYCSKSGIIRLGTPLDPATLVPDPDIGAIIAGKQVYVKYRKLSDTTCTVGQSGSVGLLSTLTPGAFVSKDAQTDLADGKIRIDTATLPYGTFATGISYWANYPGGDTVWYKNRIPMRLQQGNPVSGAVFRVAVSAGLKMSNAKQQPLQDISRNVASKNNCLIYDPRGWPMYYDGALVPASPYLTPTPLTAAGYGVKNRALVMYDVKVTDGVTAVVRGATGYSTGNRDALYCYSDGSLPAAPEVDPLAVEPVEEANPTYPDDGSGSTMFVFRVHYYNQDGLSPKPWMESNLFPGADVWGGAASGVVLYLDQNGTGDYKPHFMQPDIEENGMGATIYTYRVIPHHSWILTGTNLPWIWPHQESGGGDDNMLYQSLAMGVYHYFFGCSDDSLKFDDASFPFEHQYDGPMDPNDDTSKTGREEWGQIGGDEYSSTGLDPSAPRAVTGYAEVDRAAKRRYSSSGQSPYDSTLYVDRVNRAPRQFEPDLKYPYSCEVHPRVTCELNMDDVDAFGKGYDDVTYGFGRFYGTLFPYRTAVNPLHAGARTGGDPARLAETSGSYSKDTNVFQILYRQIDNKPPVSIKLWINDANEKSGSDAAHVYRSYTMQRRADQTNPNYTQGVWYEYKLQSGSSELPLGPHTYYFTADDGEHVVRWPVRPDQYVTTDANIPHTWTAVDRWVPTRNAAYERRDVGYMDNDYVPGPYVNHAPAVTNVSVTPGTAKEGSQFVYRATYSDADGQRVYGANITIEVNDRGDKRTFAMSPDPKYNLDPTADNSALYKSGVDFVLSTATIQDLALEKGVRRFYVEFTDDWGHQNDINDLRKGETVRYPAGDGNWVSGPVISGNSAPTLSNGRVDSVDGTSNAATLWTFRVNYRDVNNDPPALIKVFIGQLQPPDKTVANPATNVKTIVWDAGHTMIAADPTDKVYSDGSEYYFQSRLGGPDVGSTGIQYYYAFEAYDGVGYAAYKTSSKDNERSDAAGCFILQDVERVDGTHYLVRPKIAKQLTVSAATAVLDPDPARVGDILRIWGVFTNEDLSGTNYYDSGGATPPNYAGGTIALGGQIPAGKVWVLVEADTPIVGPLPVEQPAPAGVIPDIEVFKNVSSSGSKLLITDQKNGFISEDGQDRAVVLQGGVAAYVGRPSAVYVTPDTPGNIASVEGVYWLDNPDPAHKYDNYFDPAALVPPVVRQGTVEVRNGTQYALVPDTDEVYKVLGVYDNPALTGTNYYLGVGYPSPAGSPTYLWQEAFLITGDVIWPNSPNAIASIQGVYMSMNDKDPSGNLLDPAAAKPYVVPATITGGSITIDPSYNAAGAIKAILLVSSNADMIGTNYYASVDPAGDPYVGPFAPNSGNVPAEGATVYVSYVPAVNFGPQGEYTALKKALVGTQANPLPAKVYVAYYPPGDMASTGTKLSTDLADPSVPVYVKIWPKAFNPGDQFIKLTAKLPDLTTDATVVTQGVVRPSIAAKLTEFGTVTGVYIDGDATNYYAGTANPFQDGDTTIHLGTLLPNPVIAPVKIAYLPKERAVTVKYSDIRYTHLISGTAQQVLGTTYHPPVTNPFPVPEYLTIRMSTSGGTTFFVPDGAMANNINITGNSADPVSGDPRHIDGGVVGVWLDTGLTSANYFNARRTNLYMDDPARLRLTTEAPTGTSWLYARAYQKGVFFVDRWNRKLRFASTSPMGDLDRIQANYFFGTRMPKTIVPNTLPSLSLGTVAPITGSRNAQYVYTITYTDIDGPNGQMPAYVRVYIDGVPHDMVPAAQGTPVYKSGAVYTYTPSTGLTGGAHTYHFEASDGAAVAWFDKDGAHQTERGLSTLDVSELDGPWVNDPPLLTNGSVAPNPIPGGIGTTDSVDYTLNLKDVDNDPPYFFDAQRDVYGFDVSGAPRVWVDAALNDDTNMPITGYITALQADPLEVSKQRVIVAKVDDGTGNLVDPAWTPDQFAGKLMQISNGDNWTDVSPSPYLRVYLIQSNTANTLIIATDTLENDQLLVPADPATGAPRYVQFGINGLLMTKVDASQQNYALGVNYKVTVPRLAVGTHKFHFTARTRETKPLWLLDMATYANKTPYSTLVRFPTLGDVTGPIVVSVTPPGNQAPEMSKSGSSTLYRGPKAQRAKVTSPTRALPTNWNVLLNVSGVYRNANFDAHLAAADQKNILDPATSNPPATGDPVKLTGLTAMANTDEFVQHGSVNTLLTVTPDVPASVGTVTGAYLIADTGLTTVYAPTAPTLAADNTITLGTALPAGTTDVYVKYTPATATAALTADGSDNIPLPAPTGDPDVFSSDSVGYVVGVYLATDVAMANNLANGAAWSPGDAAVPLLGGPIANGTAVTLKYVPWPPVYLKYFAVEPTTATPPIHGIFTAGEPLTFKIVYKDANGDPPTYHDGVQGYVKIVFNDTGRSSQLVPQGVPTGYTIGVPFGVTLTDVPEGTHPYHFEASDGYVVSRYPTDQTGTGANDEKVQVNYKPSLKTGTVDHTSGATTFTFSVTYVDKDGAAPAAGGFVRVILTDHNDPSIVLPAVTMTTSDVAPNYSLGVRYTGVAGQDGPLPAGQYDATFVANDGVQSADPLAGPTITVRDTNAVPVIVNYEVKKLLADGSLGNGAGKTSDTFVYRAWYSDGDNDSPVAVFSGVRQTALTLIIDKDQTTEQRWPMIMVPLPQNPPPAPPTLPDYTQAAGVEFQAKVTGKKLGAGNHTYTVVASDGTVESVYANGLLTIKNGPTLMIPFFQLEVVGKDGEPITDRSIVGQEVLIKGKMYFPYTVPDQFPSSISNITIQVTKPDSATVSLNASLNNITVNDAANPQNWLGDIVVAYSGYVDPALITGQSLTLTASGQWTITASWPGDSLYDGAQTDSVMDTHNDQIRINVSGPSRTLAVADPLNPSTSSPIADMITPPMLIGSTSPGGIFGYDRALAMKVVKWVPTSGQYFWYDVGGVFPPLQPGDAVWIKPTLGSVQIPGSGYPAAEALGSSYTVTAMPTSQTLVPINVYASHINGVYLNSAKTGANYYVHSVAALPFKAGDTQIVLTSSLPALSQVWVDYVGLQNGVDEGWVALDNPLVEKTVVNNDPRYFHSKYRLIKVLAQAYPLQTSLSGLPVTDTVTKLPLLSPCTVSLSAGWNQFGSIFFNWKKQWQAGTPAVDEGPPAAPGSLSKKPVSAQAIDQYNVVPVDTNSIGKVLGVYLNQQLTGTNYYQPGISTQVYRRGDATIHLTASIPATTTTVYIKYEAYPRVDVGIPLSEVHVTHLGIRKTLAEAKAAGWLTDYAWRYDALQRNYVRVSPTASGAERALKAWSGYWIRAYVDCQLEIDPNTTYNGDTTTGTSAGATSTEELEMPPPAPN